MPIWPNLVQILSNTSHNTKTLSGLWTASWQACKKSNETYFMDIWNFRNYVSLTVHKITRILMEIMILRPWICQILIILSFILGIYLKFLLKIRVINHQQSKNVRTILKFLQPLFMRWLNWDIVWEFIGQSWQILFCEQQYNQILFRRKISLSTINFPILVCIYFPNKLLINV